MHSLCIARSVSDSLCVLALREKWADGPGNFALLSLETGRNTAYEFLNANFQNPRKCPLGEHLESSSQELQRKSIVSEHVWKLGKMAS